MEIVDLPLSDRDVELIRKHFRFYTSIDNGVRELTTEDQQRFWKVCRGIETPVSDHELAYCRLRAITQAAGAELTKIADNDFALLDALLQRNDYVISEANVRLCYDCKRPIAPERLEVFPETQLCTSCQHQSESMDWHVSEVICPRCAERGFASRLVWRTAHDPRITGYFLGCSRFPACRYLENSLFESARNSREMGDEIDWEDESTS